jgi:hypothetical protein
MSDQQLDLTPGGPFEVVPRSEERTLLDIIARAASDPQTDVDKLERLMALHERHKTREAEMAYAAALSEMQPLLPEIEEQGEILDKQGEVQSTYAKWEDVQRAIKPILAAHGFSLNFEVAREEGQIAVTAILHHRAGHSQRTTLPLPLDTSGNKNTVQAYGSSTSYGMRYTARALLNLTSRGADDDGVAGGTKLISEGEREALQALADVAQVDMRRFCAFLKIPSLDQLPARRYRVAERALQDAAAKREAARKDRP